MLSDSPSSLLLLLEGFFSSCRLGRCLFLRHLALPLLRFFPYPLLLLHSWSVRPMIISYSHVAVVDDGSPDLQPLHPLEESDLSWPAGGRVLEAQPCL